MPTFFLVKRRRKLSSVIVQCFSSFLQISPACIRILEKSLFIKTRFFSPSFVFFPSSVRPCLEADLRGGYLRSLRPFDSKPFSHWLCVCLILKLGDSYLWQLRDSTHRDPPTVEGRGKISDISMACSTDMDTVSLLSFICRRPSNKTKHPLFVYFKTPQKGVDLGGQSEWQQQQQAWWRRALRTSW